MQDAYAQDKKQLLENWALLTEGLAQAKSGDARAVAILLARFIG